MEKLLIPIEQSGYGVDFNFDIASIEFGVATKTNRNLFNCWSSVAAVFLCEQEEYDYLADFYKRFAASGGELFLTDVVLEDRSVIEMKATFKRGSFKLQSVAGRLYRVGAMLSVKPIRYDVINRPFAVDSGLIDKSLDAETGYFVLTGFAAGSRRANRYLHANAGFFTLTGSSVRRAETGYFTLTGLPSNVPTDFYYRITEDNEERDTEDPQVRITEEG